MDLTPKQQASEAIRQAETILILTGSHPTVDQAAAVIGLSAILRKFGKKVSVVVSDSLPAAAQMLDTTGIDRNLGGLRDFVLKLDTRKATVDKLRYEMVDDKLNIFITPFKGGFAPSDVTFDYGQPSFEYDLAIVVGVPTRARIDRVYEQNMDLFEKIPMVNLDFHRSNENYGAVNLIEPNASSLCEMLVATSESLQSGLIDADIATTLLLGIMGATDRFTASHTTSKSLTVAAQMMAAGARQQAVVKALRDGRGGSERPERTERPERNEKVERSNDRNRSNQQREPRSEARTEARPESLRTEPTERPATPPAPTTPLPNQTPDAMAAAPTHEPELPIIEPGHIELMNEAAPAQPAPQPEDASAPASPAPKPEPAAHHEPLRTAMADFAAAAEVLMHHPASNREPQPAGDDHNA